MTMPSLPLGLIGGLVEIVLRVRALDTMEAFYRDTLGLPVWRRFGDDMVFFKLPGSIGGRPQTLALFAQAWPSNMPGRPWSGLEATKTTMHHLAFAIDKADLRQAAATLAAGGVPVVERTFAWAGWRSLMLQDPEGNVIELVANDPSVQEPP